MDESGIAGQELNPTRKAAINGVIGRGSGCRRGSPVYIRDHPTTSTLINSTPYSTPVYYYTTTRHNGPGTRCSVSTLFIQLTAIDC